MPISQTGLLTLLAIISRCLRNILLSGLAMAIPAVALDPGKALSQYVLSSWSTQSGLSQKSIMGVAQTTDGFIWLATEEGLVRYDGLSFVTFDERNSKGLPDRFVRSLAASREGGLWLGTRSGLVRYKDGRFQSLERETNFSQDIYDICETRDGSVYFSSENGLYRFLNGKLRLYTTKDGLPDNRITAIAQGSDGAIWAGTRAGLVRFWQERFTTYVGRNGMLANSINALSVGPRGTVWIGTIDGKIERLADGQITTWWDGGGHRVARVDCIREDSDGTLWIALENLGLARMRGRNFELFTSRDGLPSSDPDWILEDRERGIWIGWADAGLSSLRDGKFTVYGTREGLSSDHISSVLQARDGSMWVGTDDAGLNHLQGGRVTTYSERRGLGGDNVQAILETADGALWSGSHEGILSRLRDGKIQNFGKPVSAPPRIAAMLQDHTGDLWLAFDTPDGLARFRNDRMEHVHLDGRAQGLAQAPDGALWIAAYTIGVTRFQSGTFRTFTKKDGLSSALVTCVYADSDGVVWVGTAQAGLNRLENGHITPYTVNQGLFDSTVRTIVEDNDGYLWLTSSRGISRVRKQELNDLAAGRASLIHSKSYGYADGLRSAECSLDAQPAAWKGKDGRLWFATRDGLASINPRRIRANQVAPDVRIESLYLDGALMSSSGFRKPSRYGRLEIGFTAANFVDPERMPFRYRLEGFDGDWVEARSKRAATYTNLPPGRYRFEVQAADSDRVWSQKGAAIDFELLPRYYQTAWFRVLCVLCVSLVGWRIYLLRVRYLMEKTRELEEKVALRTAELSKAVEAAETAREVLRHQAMRDSLTGLWSRRAIFELLSAEVSRCHRNAASLCVVMADLDHFKSINDKFGHLAGDQVLQEASRRLQEGVRRSEAVGRYGGEEVLIILTDCSLAMGAKRAQELCDAIQSEPVKTESGDIWITCSFGVSEIEPGSTETGLVGVADAALYRAKAEGRNCVRVQSNQLTTRSDTLRYA